MELRHNNNNNRHHHHHHRHHEVLKEVGHMLALSDINCLTVSLLIKHSNVNETDS
jgi:hypothetical protein